jgi:hypothetical protein
MPGVETLVYILVVGLICGGLVYVVDRMPFLRAPFNSIIKVIKVIAIIGAIIMVLEKLNLFHGFH